MINIKKTTCKEGWRFKCPVNWDSMESLPDSPNKWCRHCKRQIHFTDNPTQLKQLSQQGECVAVLYDDDSMIVGDFNLSYFTEQPEKPDLVDEAEL